MILRALTGSGDWQFGKGLASYATGEQAIEENIRTRLLSWVGDCFWALRDGVDWRNRLDVGQEAQLQEELRSIILQSYGVYAVQNVSLTRDARRNVIVTYTVDTVNGSRFTSLLSA